MRTLTTTIFVSLVALSAEGADRRCAPQLAPDLKAFLGDVTDKRVLAVDHKSGAWSLLEFDSSGSCARAELKVDASGTAKLNIAMGDYQVVVYNTNSLVYGIQEIKAEDKDRPDLAALQDAVAAIGAGVKGVVGLTTPLPFPRPSPATGDPAAIVLGGPLAPRAQAPAWMAHADALRQRMQEWSDQHERDLKPLQAAAKILGAQGAALELNRLALLSAIQIAENDGSRFLMPELKPTGIAEIRSVVTELMAQRDKAPKLPCAAELGALRDLIGLVVSAPFKQPELPERRAEQTELATDLQAKLPGDCEKGKIAIAELARELGSRDLAQPWPDAPLSLQFRIELLDYAALATDTAALVKKAGEAVEKGFGLIPTAARIAQTKQLADQSKRGNIHYTDFLKVDENWTAPEWDKVRTVTVKLAASAPLQETIVKARPAPFSASYALERSNWAFDVRVGIVLRPPDASRDIEWDAVTDPSDTSKKAIAAVSQKSRAGAPTAILTLRHRKWQDFKGQPGIDLSVSADPGRPFVGIGGSIEVASFLRLGASYAWHRVKDLEDPQRTLAFGADGKVDMKSVTRVLEASDIRTRDKIGKGWHVTLSIALSSLNPFKKD